MLGCYLGKTDDWNFETHETFANLFTSWTTFTIIGNFWTAFYVDKYGRRTFLLIGSTGCLVSLIFLCAMTACFLNTTNTAGLNAAVFFIWFYIFWWCFFIDATQ